MHSSSAPLVPRVAGRVPDLLGTAVRRNLGEVLTSEQSYAYLDADAATSLAELRMRT